MSDYLKREGVVSVGKTAHVMPRSRRRHCRKEMDRAICVNGDFKPDPGDVTICIACGHLMAYADDLSLRDLTDDEIVAVAGDKRVVDMQRVRGYAMRRVGAPT